MPTQDNTPDKTPHLSEALKQQDRERMEAFLVLGQMYNEPLEKIEKWVVQNSSQQTASEMAFCAVLDEKCENITTQVCSEKAMFECMVEGAVDKNWTFPLKDAGLWAKTVRQRTPVLVNNYAAENVEGKHSSPPGHIRLRRFLGMPVIDGKKVLAVITVANKNEPYTDEDIFHLRLLAEGLRRALCHRRDENTLQQSEISYRGLFNSVTEAIYVLDEECRFLDVNQGAEIMYQQSKDFFIGNTAAIVSAPDKNNCVKIKRDIQKAFAGEPQQFEFWGIRSNGEIFPKEVHLSKGYYFGQTVVIATARDITERKQAEKDLRIAATAFESQESIIITDAENSILRVNRAFTEVTGYTAEEVVGKNPRLLQSGRHNANFYAAIWKNLKLHGNWKGEVWDKRKNGEIYPEYLTITAVKDNKGKICNYVASFMDISISKAAAEEIQRLAFYDSLTTLPNRVLLRDRLKSALAASKRNQKKGALLLIDLDNFKNLNDSQGHDVGDLLLQQVALRLSFCVRENDTCGRFGGDEFVVILEDLSKKPLEAAFQAEAVARKILAGFNHPYLLGNQDYHTSSSIGITVFSGDQKNDEDLLKQADIAMYQAKNNGRNTLRFFDPQMQARINAHALLEKDLRQAIIEKQFKLYYQAQVLNSGDIVSAEVLVRWQHPLRGMVSPLEFIPLAEENGLILAIGEWVLETACHQLKHWQDNPSFQKLQLAVNVSARQFGQPDFVEQVMRIIERTDIRPERLKLELTESLVLIDVHDTIQKMQTLREIGVQFSMDDFGTGYSSLAYLSRLPMNQLKIDQSFVHNIGINRSDAVIVQTIIGMAHNLGIGIIAEGVETQAQRLFLEQNACYLYQGYLFSKPVPVEQFEALVLFKKV